MVGDVAVIQYNEQDMNLNVSVVKISINFSIRYIVWWTFKYHSTGFTVCFFS